MPRMLYHYSYLYSVLVHRYVTPGWLAALIFTVRHIPSVGIAGPLFIGDGNVVAEAGGLVFSDAGAANYGRNMELGKDVSSSTGFIHQPSPFASLPVFLLQLLYARRTDYISAACILMSRQLYFDVGAFDPRYKMGYYEDTDLAMAVRNAGLYVVYQPGAVVYHQVRPSTNHLHTTCMF